MKRILLNLVICAAILFQSESLYSESWTLLSNLNVPLGDYVSNVRAVMTSDNGFVISYQHWRFDQISSFDLDLVVMKVDQDGLFPGKRSIT